MANFSDNESAYNSIQDLSKKSDSYNSVLKLLWNKVIDQNTSLLSSNNPRALPSQVSSLNDLPDGCWYLPDTDIKDYDTIMFQQSYCDKKAKIQIILYVHNGNECTRSFINNKWNNWQAMTVGEPIIFTKNINMAQVNSYSGNSSTNIFTIPVKQGETYYFSMYVDNGDGDYFITTDHSINGWMHIGPNLSEDHDPNSGAGMWGAYPGEHYICEWTANHSYNMPIGVFRDGGGDVSSISQFCITESNKYIPYNEATSYKYDPFATS